MFLRMSQRRSEPSEPPETRWCLFAAPSREHAPLSCRTSPAAQAGRHSSRGDQASAHGTPRWPQRRWAAWPTFGSYKTTSLSSPSAHAAIRLCRDAT